MSATDTPDAGAAPFVSVDWLKENLDTPDLVVVDGSYYLAIMQRDAEAEFLAGHIPGAVRFDIDTVKDHADPLPHMIPTADEFASAVGAMGIDNNSRIVVYDGDGVFSAPRVWWMFTIFGANNVSILEGGFPAWRAAGGPIEQGPARRREPRSFIATLDCEAVADLPRIEAALADPEIQVVDARSAARFRGEAPEPRAGLPSGHMPGSVNLPHTEVVEDGRLKDPQSIRDALRRHGIDPTKPVITSCGSGVSAAILTLAFMRIGHPPQALFDGSWTEWASREGAPIGTGDPSTR